MRWSISVRVADGPIAQIALAPSIDSQGRPIGLDAIILNYVGHRQPGPREEPLTLTRSDAPLDGGKALISHATKRAALTMVFRKVTRQNRRMAELGNANRSDCKIVITPETGLAFYSLVR